MLNRGAFLERLPQYYGLHCSMHVGNHAVVGCLPGPTSSRLPVSSWLVEEHSWALVRSLISRLASKDCCPIFDCKRYSLSLSYHRPESAKVGCTVVFWRSLLTASPRDWILQKGCHPQLIRVAYPFCIFITFWLIFQSLCLCTEIWGVKDKGI